MFKWLLLRLHFSKSTFRSGTMYNMLYQVHFEINWHISSCENSTDVNKWVLKVTDARAHIYLTRSSDFKRFGVVHLFPLCDPSGQPPDGKHYRIHI